ncbi:glycosyltransferase [Colwellia echini]|uniref:Glycosyltransferase n=1 Tax=Colwellia echini TaxID=1982103 RepID=A0ABY3MX06_9GAMM|nr:glycosyltransferase [Colwellia echini]TYK65762.1 glycosyltransferase [Colwellia echini]
MNKKIKILHITFDMALGGTEQVIRQLVENMPSDKIEHHIFCLDGEVKELGQRLISKGFVIHSYQRKKGFDFSLVWLLRRLINKEGYDVLHCHQYTPFVYGVMASVFKRSKVIFTEHGRFYPEVVKPKRKLINPVLSLFTNKITAISKATAKAIVDFEYMPERKVQVIYNGLKLDVDQLHKTHSTGDLRDFLKVPQAAFLFGTIARLDPIKNHIMLIKAFETLCQKHKDLYLVIIGDGPMMIDLRMLVSELNMERNIVLTGFIVEPQKYLLAMDVFLLPSFSEGTSMTLLEAMACGIPPVVTRVGGNPEIVENDVSGLIVENDDQIALESAMLKLFNNKDKRVKLSAAAMARFNSTFKENYMVNNYMKIYCDLTGRE